jgi:hypothetical protein
MVGLAAAPDPAGAEAIWWRGQNGGTPSNAILSNSQGNSDRVIAVQLAAVSGSPWATGFGQPAVNLGIAYPIQSEGFTIRNPGYPISIIGANSAATYDLYVYGGHDFATDITLNDVTKSMTGAINDGITPWSEGVEYVRFEGLTGQNTYIFTGAMPPGADEDPAARYAITGLQLVQTSGGSSAGSADINGDGVVDGLDLLEWQRQYGNTASTAVLTQIQDGYGTALTANAVVPEPTAITLVGLGCLFLCRRRIVR